MVQWCPRWHSYDDYMYADKVQFQLIVHAYTYRQHVLQWPRCNTSMEYSTDCCNFKSCQHFNIHVQYNVHVVITLLYFTACILLGSTLRYKHEDNINSWLLVEVYLQQIITVFNYSLCVNKNTDSGFAAYMDSNECCMPSSLYTPLVWDIVAF